MARTRRLGRTAFEGDLRGRLILIASLLLVAACMRPMITAVGPLMGAIHDSTGLGELALGTLGALPLLAFAAASPFVAGGAVRWGVERMVALSLLTLAIAVVARSTAGTVGLWMGTALIGAAIAVGNVLVPALIKTGFPSHAAVVTGAYSAAMGGFAAAGAGAAVPLTASLGGWRWALGAWAVLPMLVALVWLMRPAAAVSPTVPAQSLLVPRMWKSPSAWMLTAFFGLQSATFYTTITWLPTIEASFGVDPHTGGVHLLIYQLVGMLGGVAVTWMMHGRMDQRWPAFLVSVPVALAMLGFVLVPGLGLLWVVIAATGSAGSLTVALSLITLRTASAPEAAALSGMAQSLGYLLAALGPVAAGFMASLWSSWTPTLFMIACLASIQAAISRCVGRLEPVLVLSDGARS